MKKLFTLLVILQSCCCFGQWTTMAPMPSGTAQHAAVAHPNGNVYVIGGYDGTPSAINLYSTLRIYNIAANTWTTGAALPAQVRGMGYCLGSDNNIYVTSGSGPSGNVSGVYRYNVGTGTWTTLASIPSPVWEAGTASYGGKIFVAGGWAGGAINNLQIYDIATNTWSAGAALPTSLMQQKLISTGNGVLYMFGGTLASQVPVSTVYRYTIASNTWSASIATMPATRDQFGAALGSNGKIYLTGGKQSYFNGNGPFFNTHWIFNPLTNAFTTGPALPATLGENTLVSTSDGRIYCMGGTNGSALATNYSLGILQGPANVVTGIQLWLDGSNINNTTPATNPANNVPITTWKDISGNVNDASVLAGQNTPQMNTSQINGKDVVKFTRANQGLGTVYEVPGVDIRSVSMPQTTIFTVYKQGAKSGNEWHGIWGADNLNWDRFFMSSFGLNYGGPDDGIVSVGPPTFNVQVPGAGVTGETKLLTAVYDSGVSNGSTIYFNAVPVQTVTDGTDPTDAQPDLRIGWDGDDNPYNGDIAEMVVYNRKLTECEIKTVNRYFGYKYGVTFTSATITPAPKAYFCTGGTTILTASTGNSYQWLKNGALIGGATSGTLTAGTVGSYQVIVSAGGCSDTSLATTLEEVFPTLYVDSSVAVSGTGGTWSTAKKTLGEALALANGVSCATQIWVKKGTYFPTAGTNRDSAFYITRNGIKVYGGFAGTETLLSQRNISANTTILSGAIGAAADSTDNSYHVMAIVGNSSNNIDTTTVVSGFTITGGYSMDAGGNTITIMGMTLYRGAGGGINCAGLGFGSQSSPKLDSIIFTRNSAVWGGGLYCQAHGGGNASPVVRNSQFNINTCLYDGGGYHGYSDGGGNAGTSIFNSSFTNNKAVNYFGGALYNNNSSMRLSDVVFTGNTSQYLGGGIANLGSGSLDITRGTFSNQVALGDGGAVYSSTSGSLSISSSKFLNNSAGSYGGGIVNVGGPMSLRNCTFSANSCGGGGGGAVHSNNGGSDTVINCVFANNTTTGVGGGIHHSFNALTLRIINSTFAGNTAGNGGGLYLESNGANGEIANSIFWGNTAASNPNIGKNGSGTLTVTYSDVQGGFAGTGNIATNPLYANAGDPDGADNVFATADDGLHVSLISAALNSGSNALVPAGVTTDVKGAARIQQAIVDMGAYEGGLAACPGGTRVYVDSTVVASGDGTSWAQAYKTAWEGLTIANSCPLINEVWVANGTYFPMRSPVVKAASRDSSLRILRNGVKVYGGFAGTEMLLSQRNITANTTTLSGDIGTLNDSTDNAYHTVTITRAAGSAAIDTTTILDGFTVTRGNATGGGVFVVGNTDLIRADGGGIYPTSSSSGDTVSPLIQNCIITRNTANVGGAVYCAGYTGGVNRTVIRACTISFNKASDVAGVHSRSGNTGSFVGITVTACTFTGNTATNAGGAMGAFSSGGGLAAPVAINTVFTGNTAVNQGGAFNIYSGTFTATNCVFTGNGTTSAAGAGGGVIFVPGGSTATLNNSTLSENTTVSTGSAGSSSVRNDGTLNVNNSIIWGAAAQQVAGGGTANYNYSDVKGITPPANSISALPQFANAADPDGADNIWATADDGLKLSLISPAVNSGNNALIPAGITTDITGAARIQSTTVDMGAYEGPVIGCPGGTRVYVDSTVASSGDGTSWSQAYKTVWEGLATANSCPAINEVWVAKGTYYPMRSPIAKAVSRDSSLRIFRNGVKVYGGFAGGETTLTQRNITANLTTLSGDIGTLNDSTDNSYHVMTIVASSGQLIDTTTIVDGFTITRGNGFNATGSFTVNGQGINNQDGGGIYFAGGGAGTGCNPKIANCIITRNAANFGGGAYAAGYSAGNASPIIDNCTFTGNRAAFSGGGVFWGGSGGTSSAIVRSTIFSLNNATQYGGGVYSNGGSSSTPVYTSCLFLNNNVSEPAFFGYGGGMFNAGNYATVNTSRFTGNTTGGGGGGIGNNNGAVTTVRNTVFSGNSALTGTIGSGGGYQQNGGAATSVLTNCVFTGNVAGGTADDGGGAIMNYGGTITLNNSTLSNNTTASTSNPNSNSITVYTGATVVLNNTIAWGGAAQQVQNLGTFTPNYSLVKGLPLVAPNLTSDPQFINASDPDGADNIWATSDDGLRLTPCSPAINAGSNALIPAGVTTDITAATRIQNTTVDMGAYEMPNNSTGLPDIAITKTSATVNCSSAPVTFSATTLVAPGGTTNITWFVNSTSVQTGSGTTYGSSTLANNDTVWAVLFNADCNLRDTSNRIVITVTSVPAQPSAITGATTVCPGLSQTYSVTNDPAVTTYNWTLPTGWTGTSTTNTITVTPGSTGGTITVTGSNFCGPGAPSSLAVTAIAVPAQPGPIAGASAVCAGVSQTYSVTAVTYATSYTWTLPVGWTGSSNTNTITVIPNGTGGTISVTAAGACGTSAASTKPVTSTVIPATPSAITGATAVCAGVAQTYSVTADPNVTSYTWTLPTGWTGSSTTSTITVTPNGTGGTITVTGANYCGPSAASTKAVTSTIIPVQPSTISGPAAVCTGISATYSVTADANVTSYTWTIPAGWSGSSTTNTITVIPTATGGTITVNGTNYCGPGATRTLSVTSTATPAQPGTITGAAAVCAGVPQTYSVTAVSNATTYTWTLPAGWSGTSTTNTITVTPTGTGGTVSVTASNYCGTSASATKAVSSTVIPVQPTAISGSTAVCAGVAQTYTVTNDPNVTTYAWTLPAGWTGTSTTNTITAIPTATGGTISVTGSNYCGPSAVRTLSVSSTATPAQPGTISGAAAICNGSTQTYTVAAVANATGYSWSLPAGWSGASTTNTITVVASATSGTVSVTASNYCGTSTAQSLAVTVTSIPVQPGAISGSITPCEGTQQTYSIGAVPAATSYAWSYPSGWIGGSTTTAISLLTSVSSGAVSVTASNFCGTSPAQSLGISTIPLPAQPQAISGPVQVCSGTQQTYSVPLVPNTSAYQWTLPAGWIGTSTTNTITVTTGTTSGTITVSAFGTCGYGPQRTLSVTTTQTVIPTVSATITSPGGNVICAGTPVTFSQTSTNAGTAPVYTWRRNGAVVWIGATYTAYNLQNGDSITVSVTSAATCAIPQTVTGAAIYMTVNPVVVPGINISTTPPASLCAGTQIVLYTNTVGGGSSPQYQWYKNGAIISGQTDDSLMVTAAIGTDTFTVQLLSNAPCATPGTASSNKRWIVGVGTVTPTISVTASPGVFVPAGSTVVFTANYTNGGVNPVFRWRRNGVLVAGAISATYVGTNIQNSDTVSAELTNYDGCAIPGTVRAGIRIGTPTGIGTNPGGGSGTWDENGSIVIHPNPSSGRFEIDAEWGADHIGERVVIELYNALGQTVYSTEVKPDKRKWTVSVWLGDAVANGIYQLSIRTPTMRAARPVLLSR